MSTLTLPSTTEAPVLPAWPLNTGEANSLIAMAAANERTKRVAGGNGTGASTRTSRGWQLGGNVD